MKNKPVCLRCGKCCYYETPSGWKKCKYLVRLKGGKTLCRIYNNRINAFIDVGISCDLRENDPREFLKCPFNKKKGS